jgi:Flp pilus assembly protein TadG
MIKRNVKGQSLVETALVLPIILLLLMGIIDFGFMFNNYLMVGNASREGARKAAAGATDSEIRALVGNASATLDASRMTVTITPSQLQRKKGDEVAVTVDYDYSMITPIISSIVPGPLHLRSRSVMRVE